jgi:hypothetical protein
LTREDFLYSKVNVPDIDAITAEMRTFKDRLGVPHQVQFRNVENLGAKGALPSTMRWFDSVGLNMAECVYIVTPPRVITNIHKDIFAPNCLALNFPVVGCESVRTHFYKELIDLPLVQPGSNPHYNYRPDEIEFYESCCVNEPTMLNVHVLHSVNNLTTEPRIVFSFRFREAPWALVGL